MIWRMKAMRVTLYRRKAGYQSMTTISGEDIVLNYFGSNPKATNADLCNDSGLTKHDAEVAIKSLKEKGLLKRIGSSKEGNGP